MRNEEVWFNKESPPSRSAGLVDQVYLAVEWKVLDKGRLFYHYGNEHYRYCMYTLNVLSDSNMCVNQECSIAHIVNKQTSFVILTGLPFLLV